MLYGDSLLAGYGLAASEGFLAQLQQELDARGNDVRVVNASVSGDTTADALRRVDWALSDRPDAVLVGLGANDMLEGLPVTDVRRNIGEILRQFKARSIPVLLLGMRANRGLGPDYVEAFDQIYPEMAAQHGALLYPFFLDGVALDPDLNQADLRHPNAAGVKRIVAAVTPLVELLVGRVKSPATSQ